MIIVKWMIIEDIQEEFSTITEIFILYIFSRRQLESHSDINLCI